MKGAFSPTLHYVLALIALLLGPVRAWISKKNPSFKMATNLSSSLLSVIVSISAWLLQVIPRATRIWLIAALFLVQVPNLIAQPKLKEASRLLEQGAYIPAIEQLDEYLDAGEHRTLKQQINAHLLRGEAYYQVTQDIYLLGLHPDAFLKAFHDLEQVNQLDKNGKFQPRVFGKLQLMRSDLLDQALRKVSEANIPGLRHEQATELANTAQVYLDILLQMEPNNYLFYDLRGQAKLARGDSLPAAMDFQSAIQLYTAYPPLQADLLFAYAYYRTAIIQRLSLDYAQQALHTLQAGLHFLVTEWARVDQPNRLIERQYQQACKALRLYELDILYAEGTVTPEVRSKFATAVEAYPNEYALRCAYASFLETTHPAQASGHYKKAIALQPEQKMAYYNLAALYINQSIGLLEETPTPEAAAQAEQLLQQAIPYLQKTHQIAPEDKQVIHQLMTIFLQLNQMDQYLFFQAKLAKLENS